MSTGENAGALQPCSPPEKVPAISVKEVIQEKAPDVLKGIPQDKIEALARISIERHEYSMRSSPLPEPSELAAYNQIIPNGADRIMKMVEAQSAHRIALEKKVVGSQQRQGFYGIASAFIIAIWALGCATYAAIGGQPSFGSIIGSATLISLVTAFLTSRPSQNKELAKKNDAMLPQHMLPPQMQRPNQRNKKRRGKQ